MTTCDVNVSPSIADDGHLESSSPGQENISSRIGTYTWSSV